MNRRRYYDIFSHIYDSIIALHSRDSASNLRKFLVEKTGIQAGGRLLDICTGTGAVPLSAASLYGKGIFVAGLDFSWGMLEKAHKKTKDGKKRVSFVQADASSLPFQSDTFDAVTCSHAMYELGSMVRRKVLKEAYRVLVPGGCFAMMEHCEPERVFIRFLYRIRLGSFGSKENLEFARDEVPFLSKHFSGVKMVLAPGRRSKVIYGFKS